MKRPRAMIFDVFGTVLDWKGTIVAEGLSRGRSIDWNRVAEAWAEEYSNGVRALNGEWGKLGPILEYGFTLAMRRLGHNPGDFPGMATLWYRLWPHMDAPDSFERMSYAGIRLFPFTNADSNLMESLAESSGLPWSRPFLTSQAPRAFKPDPRVYKAALGALGEEPGDVMLVAAHCFDLNAGHKHGIRTALITRQGEPGSDPSGLDHEAEIIVPDLGALADRILEYPLEDR